MNSKYLISVKRLLILICVIAFANQTSAQDVQFSQYFAVSPHLNPALTGNVDGRYRILTVYRDQNRATIVPPLQTFGFGGDVKFELGQPGSRNANQFGIGVFFFSDKAATFQHNTNNVNLNLAYHKKLGLAKSDLISLGFLIGVQQKNINYDNLNFGDEFNFVDAYDQSTSEVLPPNNFGFADVGIGLAYSANLREGSAVMVGGALQHVNTPNLSYYRLAQNVDPQLDVDFQLPMKFTGHISIDLKTADFFSILPRLVYIQQGEHMRISAGSYLKFDFIQTQSAFLVGAWIRAVNDVDGLRPRYVIPTIGFNKGSFQLGLSYDINLYQSLGNAANLNALELSIRFIGSFENDDYFCPSF